ncbi:class I SAM-dependent methyltransferase [Capnocytophaga felis]|uniref:Small RNA 2'-O-methyltransferase n=1 Tax=Capnocytophaga felis TaxID=2267611 RepID=A0A5M4B9P9_9FLAO|nr:class I SAM-dependent methyltransferase [Capnocytophaga felis]GET46331.1 hypothetical protein RCZ01_16330 [Capnocytophaga felis]GET48161.1 hypothetical protein RCZ02_09920 [Capnocytophaga felis]
MIIQIQSENPKLLDILNKNPNTDFGIYAKSLRNGQIIGNTLNPNRYDVIFQDTRYSYLPEESNQIDFQSYCSPLVILHICNELFKDLLQEKETYFNQSIKWLHQTKQEVDTEECTIEVKNMYINSSWYKHGHFLMEKYFKNVKITPLIGNNVSLFIQGNNVFEAFNLLSFIAVIVHITNEYGEFTYIDDSFAQKYARILTNIDNVPYFVFYLFIKKAVKSERQLNEIKPMFEAYFRKQNIEIEFQFSDTHGSRMDFAVNQLEFDFPILDIGCGELKYYRRFMRKNYNYNHPYFAVDTAPEVQKIVENFKEKYDAENLFFFSDLSDFKYDKPVNILLTEVIEHNTPEEAKRLVKQCLSFNFNKLIITTPNSEFNVHYFDNEENMRHSDHYFEWNKSQFESFVKNCLEGKNYKYTFHDIGDKINEICPTQAVVIENNKK